MHLEWNKLAPEFEVDVFVPAIFILWKGFLNLQKTRQLPQLYMSKSAGFSLDWRNSALY